MSAVNGLNGVNSDSKVPDSRDHAGLWGKYHAEVTVVCGGSVVAGAREAIVYSLDPETVKNDSFMIVVKSAVNPKI